jgi:hypothetical protein
MGNRWTARDDEEDGVLPPNFYYWLLAALAVVWLGLALIPR